MTETSPPPGSAPLNGWKDIASYLGRSVRAVQRWERELGLPVHRIRTAEGQTVYAFREEIDKWRANVDARKVESDHNGEASAQNGDSDAATAAPAVTTSAEMVPDRRKSVVWLSATAAILLAISAAGLAYWWFAPPTGPSARFQWNGNLLQAIDSRGRTLWSQDFDSATARDAETSAGPQFEDFDGDGNPELIVAVRFDHRGVQEVSDAVYSLSKDGDVQWKYVPTEVIQCGSESFAGPWRARVLAVEQPPGPRRVWIAFVHHTWRPSFVVAVDPGGTSSLRYVQAGWVTSLVPWATPAGHLLAAGGVLNEFGRASLVLLDATGPASASPSEHPAFQCGQAPSTGVQRMFLFPQLETTPPPHQYDFVTELRIVGPDVKVRQEGQALFRVGPDLQLKEYALADNFFGIHQQQEADGLIQHSINQCPLLTAKKDIKEWTPGTGWRDVTIAPQPRYPPATSRR